MGLWCVYSSVSMCPQVIGFFSQRLEQAGADLSVERVQEVIKKGAVALPKDRLKVTRTFIQPGEETMNVAHSYVCFLVLQISCS